MIRITISSCFIAIGFALSLVGCGDEDKTPAGHFDGVHGGKTVTPDGTVVPGSPRDTEDGSVEYETTSGRRFETKVDSNGRPISLPKPVN